MRRGEVALSSRGLPHGGGLPGQVFGGGVVPVLQLGIGQAIQGGCQRRGVAALGVGWEGSEIGGGTLVVHGRLRKGSRPHRLLERCAAAVYLGDAPARCIARDQPQRRRSLLAVGSGGCVQAARLAGEVRACNQTITSECQ